MLNTRRQHRCQAWCDSRQRLSSAPAADASAIEPRPQRLCPPPQACPWPNALGAGRAALRKRNKCREWLIAVPSPAAWAFPFCSPTSGIMKTAATSCLSSRGWRKIAALLSHLSGATAIQRHRSHPWLPAFRAPLLGRLSNRKVRSDLLAINTVSGAKRLRRVRQANATVEPPAVDALEPARVAGPVYTLAKPSGTACFPSSAGGN